MRKYACLAQLAALATQFEQWTERERDRGETCRIQQTYVDVRTHFKQWYELYKQEGQRRERLWLSSKWILVSLLAALDRFIEWRVTMIGRIKDLNALDKDSLKHFSKLVHEFNALVATDVVIDRITPNIEFAPWEHERISIVLATTIAPPVADALCDVFSLQQGAEKDWNRVWKELVFYRDLVIVLYYSRAKLEHKEGAAHISSQVKVWSSKFIDTLLAKVQAELLERSVTISVFRHNSTLPKELLAMITRIDEHVTVEKSRGAFHLNLSRLTSTILKDSFLASSTTTSKLLSALTVCDDLSTKIPSDEYLLNLNMCLACAAIIPVRLDQFFQNGALKPFFKLLFGELDALQKTLQGCWPNLEHVHNRIELYRAEHPGKLIFCETAIDQLNSTQETLTRAKDNNVLNYNEWVKETMVDVLEAAYPSGKYWRTSSTPKHTDLAEQLIEQVIDPIGQSVGDFTPELQFAILQLLVNGVCETLLEHIKKTNYKYSIQGASKLQSYCIQLHDAIRDERHLHARVVDQLGKLASFKKLFTVCQILSQPIAQNAALEKGVNAKRDYHVNMVAPAASSSSSNAPVMSELEHKIVAYNLDRHTWAKMRLKPSRFGRVLLCKE